MIVQFAKMHGLGNDFVVLDTITQNINLSDIDIERLGNRHFGIGFDQMLVIEAPGSSDVDFNYRIFNADGSEVEQCGNGARCFGRYVSELGLTWKQKIKVSTAKGNIVIFLENNGNVSVNMGVPKWKPQQIPILADGVQTVYNLEAHGQVFTLGCVSMGNPHGVLIVDDVDQYDVNGIGAALTQLAFFPERANIGFMEIVSAEEIKLRVYERGVGETKACGTGACAAVVIGQLQEILAHKVQVRLPGGSLSIHCQGPNKPVYMSGPAEFVYYGQLELG